MSLRSPAFWVACLAIGISMIAFVENPVIDRVKTLGLFRYLSTVENIHGEDFQLIPNTFACEDLHHHLPSGLLFGVSEPDTESRWKWFPPFSGPFVTHGIDIYSPPDDDESLYIFAVNHLANPVYSILNGGDVPRARSQIEVFHHTIGTLEAKHLRSIRHQLIRTPNDIYVVDEQHFYVTNDHFHRDGVMRMAEGVITVAAWSNIIHVEILKLDAKEPSEQIEARVAIDRLHNPNGFAHGKDGDEILMGRAAAGVMSIMKANSSSHLTITESIQLPMCVDNPSYFHDPYVTETGRNASGYVLCGLLEAFKFPSKQDPIAVRLIARESREQRLIFQDSGDNISTGSTAVIVAIDPKENGGRKQAWLFVVGPMAAGMVRMKIDL